MSPAATWSSRRCRRILSLKLSIMKELNEIVSDDTILASNTSSIPIAELAARSAVRAG